MDIVYAEFYENQATNIENTGKNSVTPIGKI
jgi:hypothetical protein